MRRLAAAVAVATIVSTLANDHQDRCTAILVGAKASVTGAPMTTHSNDCPDCDFRLVKVHPMTHASGAMRDVVLVSSQYPRYVGNARGSGYSRSHLDPIQAPDGGFIKYTDTIPIAQIVQVNYTYGYLEGVYGIMNDQQLAMGESTCGAKFASKPIGHGGVAYFDITELGRLALERTSTARDAIALMGRMAETHGYYGANWDDNDGSDPRESAGEALTIADAKGEAWMFHILPDDSGASAVWVAQRVPDTHITVVANEFMIHQVNLADTDNFMGSTNMHEIAERNGFWNPATGPFDFTVAFGLRPSWPYGHTRRVWRVLTLANPALDLSPTTDAFATSYPFSVEVAQPLAAADLMRYHRDHYENTPFDLTQGPAAGPYGNPNRYGTARVEVVCPAKPTIPRWHFERAISIYDATYTFVTSIHPTNVNLGFLWFGPYAPHATIYVPIFVRTADVPAEVGRGSLRQFNSSSLFWANLAVGNYASLWYKFTRPVMADTQRRVEDVAELAVVYDEAQAALAKEGDVGVTSVLTRASNKFASTGLAAATALFQDLVTRFHNGSVVIKSTEHSFSVQYMGYPTWWLDSVGYYNSTQAGLDDSPCNVYVSGGIIAAFCVLVVGAMAAGFILGQRASIKLKRGYAFIQ
ncbi:hypothetical protein H310_10282 [Aphanomyces invadans]|uniref:Peptidase n=1 Tax=Aphanomyces invadans TaxID=157072 RepID=A0A024TSG7_9STRA|nr:hypothetical protein H310_10282 [Aphanomyces invadans]ETV96581.1 hypothetical protein H310_10282 [Aphanomyces invadans]|eukprot:XP_008874844.1 hypothetical protein H310_10282 [Aphanomyces invadans]